MDIDKANIITGAARRRCFNEALGRIHESFPSRRAPSHSNRRSSFNKALGKIHKHFAPRRKHSQVTNDTAAFGDSVPATSSAESVDIPTPSTVDPSHSASLVPPSSLPNEATLAQTQDSSSSSLTEPFRSPVPVPLQSLPVPSSDVSPPASLTPDPWVGPSGSAPVYPSGSASVDSSASFFYGAFRWLNPFRSPSVGSTQSASASPLNEPWGDAMLDAAFSPPVVSELDPWEGPPRFNPMSPSGSLLNDSPPGALMNGSVSTPSNGSVNNSLNGSPQTTMNESARTTINGSAYTTSNVISRSPTLSPDASS